MTDEGCQMLFDIRCHAVTGAVQNRSCCSSLSAAVNPAVSLLGCVLCSSIGLGTEKCPLLLLVLSSDLQSMGVGTIRAVIHFPSDQVVNLRFLRGRLRAEWTKRGWRFISTSPNFSTKLRHKAERALCVTLLLYFTFSVNSECYAADKTKST